MRPRIFRAIPGWLGKAALRRVAAFARQARVILTPEIFASQSARNGAESMVYFHPQARRRSVFRLES
jgi:hypothetical protein